MATKTKTKRAKVKTSVKVRDLKPKKDAKVAGGGRLRMLVK